jgi:hypothetical protein
VPKKKFDFFKNFCYNIYTIKKEIKIKADTAILKPS